MEPTNECPIKGCLGKLLGAAVVTFVLLLCMGYLIHHVWLMPIYEATASLWRPVEQMQQMLPLMLLYYAVLALVIAALFCKAKKGREAVCATASEAECAIGGKYCPIKFGLCFGLLIGLFMGTLCAGSYIWTPIPGELAVKWFIGDVVQGIVIGVVLSLICHCCKKKGGAA